MNRSGGLSLKTSSLQGEYEEIKPDHTQTDVLKARQFPDRRVLIHELLQCMVPNPPSVLEKEASCCCVNGFIVWKQWHRFVLLLIPGKSWSLTEITQRFPHSLPVNSTSEGHCAKTTSVSAAAHRARRNLPWQVSPAWNVLGFVGLQFTRTRAHCLTTWAATA